MSESIRPETNIEKEILNKFFIVGPPRTGTTIMARCIDDHPNSICLFESHIERAAFNCPVTRGHRGRMRQHGFTPEQTRDLIDKVHDSASYIHWYDDCAKILKPLYHKENATHIGDVVHGCVPARETIKLFPKICTVRDPRAVAFSGKKYLNPYIASLQASLPYLDETTLVIKFEDFISKPEETMNRVYEFLNLPYNDSFMNRVKKPYDQRFRFNLNATQTFDVSIIDKWKRASNIPIPKKMKDLAAIFGY